MKESQSYETLYLTYKAPRCNALCLILSGGRAYRLRMVRPSSAPVLDISPPRTHAPVTNPRPGQTRDRCMRRLFGGKGQMSGHVMLTGGRNLSTTVTAAVGPQCWVNIRYPMRGVSVIGSRLKSTKLPELYRFVPADSLPRPPPPVMWLLSPLSGRTEIAVWWCSWWRV